MLEVQSQSQNHATPEAARYVNAKSHSYRIALDRWRVRPQGVHRLYADRARCGAAQAYPRSFRGGGNVRRARSLGSRLHEVQSEADSRLQGKERLVCGTRLSGIVLSDLSSG